MSDTDKRWLWYEKPGFVIGAIAVLWPVGLTLMWIQKKFSLKARIAISVAAPVLTAILAASLLTGSPGNGDGLEGTGTTDDSVVPSASVLTTSTTTGTVSATGSPSATTSPSAQGPATSGSDTSAPKPAQNPAPNPTPPPVDPNRKTRFTLEGTYRSASTGMKADFTLKATPRDGIVTYEWWVYSGGATASYDGIEISGSHTGLPPTSVRLVMYDAQGKTYTSAASVYVSGDRLTANGY
jgi:hypothetical protein